MTQLDVRLLVGLRGPDLVATTARLALVQKMGFADRLLALERYDFFHMTVAGEDGASVLIDALQKTLARQSTFYNRNKHMYSLECRWNGQSRTDGPSHHDLHARFGHALGNAGAPAGRAGEAPAIDFNGKGAGKVDTVKESPAFLVEAVVEDDDSAGRDGIAAKLTRELSGMLGRTVTVTCPSRATVWWLGIAARDEAAAMDTAKQITVTKRRDAGLLMNPNYQRAEFVSAGRIGPGHS
ncbi:MAG TPA: hypothetical protein VFX92_08490 [Candidatus Krumholzibacteria bacterium]|nr:hypothetical protein [Candidatus Krumholzibacteria bacterium]